MDYSQPLAKPRHEKFAQLLFRGETIISAYEKAGYRKNSNSANRLNSKKYIQERVKYLQSQVAERNIDEASRILDYAQKAYNVDISEIYEEIKADIIGDNGEIKRTEYYVTTKKLSDIPIECRKVIKSFSVKSIINQNGDKYILTMAELAQPESMIRLSAQHHGLLDKIEDNDYGNINIIKDLGSEENYDFENMTDEEIEKLVEKQVAENEARAILEQASI